MNKKQLTTYRQVFEKPTRSDITFKDIEKMMLALGFDRIEGRGSRVTFRSSKGRIMFHRPHPQKEAKMYVIDNLRKFLIETGITPDTSEDDESKK